MLCLSVHRGIPKSQVLSLVSSPRPFPGGCPSQVCSQGKYPRGGMVFDYVRHLVTIWDELQNFDKIFFHSLRPIASQIDWSKCLGIFYEQLWKYCKRISHFCNFPVYLWSAALITSLVSSLALWEVITKTKQFLCRSIVSTILTINQNAMNFKFTYHEITQLVEVHWDVSPLDRLVALNDSGLTGPYSSGYVGALGESWRVEWILVDRIKRATDWYVEIWHLVFLN